MRCALVALSVLVAGCGSGERPPDVVLVVIDTARQDRFSCYGYERDTTPEVDALAAEGVRYANAYSVSSWTAPAHASLFTGRLPRVHGCTQQAWNLDGRLPTLAERLAAAGYATIGIVENAVLARERGFGRGFDEYHEAWRKKFQRADRDAALALFEQHVAERDEGVPSFVFVNLIAPHNPYDSAGEFQHEFAPAGTLDRTEPWRFYLGEVTYTEDELAQLGAMYDAELRYADAVVGGMVAALERAGRLDDTVFVVTSDHGENLGDHGHVDHYFNLYETTIRVPLVIRYPAAFPRGSVERGLVQLTDLFPTLLRLAGAEEPGADGLDLLGARERRWIEAEYYRPRQALLTFGDARDDPRLDRWKRHLRSVIVGDTKLIWADDGQMELYDLGEDADECQDLAGDPSRRADLETMKLLVQPRRTPGDERAPGSLDLEGVDEETLEALKRMGYVGDE